MTGNSDSKIGGLLLAAGGSSRFGSPKQLAHFEGKSLLRRAALTLVNSACNPVVVVLGSETVHSPSEIADLPVSILVNDEWRSGMSSSIKCGLIALTDVEPELSGVMITLCDQPYVTNEAIRLFIDTFCGLNSNIVAAEYAGIVGVPALFSRPMFDILLNLDGDKGARELIQSHISTVAKIDLPLAAFDIDSLDDLPEKSCSIRD